MRAIAKSKAIADDHTRSKAEAKLERLKTALQKVTPKRGGAAIALDEASRLVSKIVTNRDQATRLIEALRRLSG